MFDLYEDLDNEQKINSNMKTMTELRPMLNNSLTLGPVRRTKNRRWRPGATRHSFNGLTDIMTGPVSMKVKSKAKIETRLQRHSNVEKDTGEETDTDGSTFSHTFTQMNTHIHTYIYYICLACLLYRPRNMLCPCTLGSGRHSRRRRRAPPAPNLRSRASPPVARHSGEPGPRGR